MSYLQGYAPVTRTRAVLRLVAAVVVFALSALDALVSAVVGVPSLAGSVRRGAAAVRRVYLAARYGPASECTDVELHIVEGEFVDDEGAGR
jgi:hypothetical protein